MNGLDPFLAQIEEHPGDDGPKLVLADWLEERGDPAGQAVRACVAAGKWPRLFLSGRWRWWKKSPAENRGADDLPPDLFDRLRGGELTDLRDHEIVTRGYPSPLAACLDLARALAPADAACGRCGGGKGEYRIGGAMTGEHWYDCPDCKGTGRAPAEEVARA